MLNIDGQPCTNKGLIKDDVVNFFSDLFNGHSTANDLDFGIIPEVIPKLVTNEDNQLLVRAPSFKEIKQTVFSMNEHSTPGPDGSGGYFYKSFWDIIGQNVIEAVIEFFTTGKIFRNLNSNFMVLIPKQESAASLDNFRPIVIRNFIFKIITKFIADRLNIITSRIISLQQFGFICRRRIHNCIALASEPTNCLDGKKSAKNMAIQINVKKAFDTLDWKFLLVMRCFGFSKTFCDWIKTFSILPEFLFSSTAHRLVSLNVLEESCKETHCHHCYLISPRISLVVT